MRKLAKAMRKHLEKLVDQYDARLRNMAGYDQLPEVLRRDLERHVLSVIVQCLEKGDYTELVEYTRQRAIQWEAQGLDLTWFQQALVIPEEILTPLLTSVEASNFLWRALNRSQGVVWQMVANRAQQAEERFRSIVETSHSGVLITDDAFRLTYVNDELVQISGYSREELLNTDFRQLFDKESRQIVIDHYVRRQQGENVPPRYEVAFLQKNGDRRYIEMNAAALQDLDGKTHTIAQVLDISERKQAEQALRDSQQLLQSVMDNIPQAVFWKDRQLQYLGCNQAFIEDAGLAAPQQIIGKTDYDMPWTDQAELYRADDRQVMDSGTAKINYEEPQTTPTGETTWLRTSKVPMRDADGNVIAILGMYEDITLHKHAEASLAHERNLLRTLIDHLPDQIFFKDVQGRVILNNLADARVMGLTSPEEAIGKNDFDFYPRELAEQFYADDMAVIQSGQPLSREEPNIGEQGQPRWMQTSKIPITNEHGECIGLVGIARDITGRRQVEQLLQREKVFSDAVLNGLPGIFYMFDPQGKLLRWNKNIVERLGYSDEEITQMTALDFFPEDEREHIYNRIKEVFAQGSADVEANFQTKAGKKIPYYLTGLLTIIDDAPYLLGVAVDISERKQLEQQVQATLQKERASSERLRAIVNTGYELIQTPDLDSLYRETVELAHTKLGVERCELFILDEAGEYLVGMYGTDEQGSTIDQRSEANRLPTSHEMEHDLLFAPRERLWTSFYKERTLWRDGQMHGMEKGWNVATVLRGPTKPLGVLYNDAAISNAPYDETLQESIALYCTMVANIIENKLLEQSIRESLARRDTQVQTGTIVAQEIAAAHDLNTLLQQVVTLIKEQFGYYHVQVFRYNPAQDAVVLVTGYGEAGRQMLAASHKLPMGRGVVGRAAASGQSILATDVTQDKDWRPNPLLPDTRGELAIPIKLREEVLGILDVQSEHAGALSEEDRLLLEGLCGQIASAMDSTRLLERTETLYNVSSHLNAAQTYDDVLAVLRQYTVLQHADLNISLNLFDRPWVGADMPEWSIVLSRHGGLPAGAASARYPLKAFSAASALLQPDEPTVIADVHADPRLDPAARELYGKRFGAGSTLFVPLVAAGQWIGYVNGIFQQPRTFSEEEVRLLMAAASQAGTVIEALHRLSELATSEGRLSEALKIAQLANWEYDVLTDTFTFNEQFYALLRTTAEREGGYTMSSAQYAQRFVHPDDAPIVGREVQLAIEASDPNYSRQIDHRIIYADGEPGYITVRFRIEKDAQGRTVRTSGANQDITERKQAEEAVRRSEAQLFEALKIAKLANWEYDVAQDQFIFNDQFYAIFHTTAAQVGGYRISSAQYAQQFVHPDDLPIVGAEIEKALNSTDRHYTRLLEHRILYADGGIGYISVNINIDRDEQGHILRYYGANQDITERKLAELRLQELFDEAQRSERLMRTIIEAVPDNLYVKNRKSEFIVANKAVLAQLGCQSLEELVGKTDFNFYPRAMAEKFYQDEQAIFESGQPLLNIEEPSLDAQGNRTWRATTKVFFYNQAGEIEGLVGLGRDITKNKLAEVEREGLLAEQQKRAQQLQAVSEVSRTASSVLNLDKLLPEATELIRERFGLYYVGLFLLDDDQQWAILQAGTGDAGQRMLADGYKLRVDKASMIGQCIATQRARIALDVGKGAVRFDNPLLPSTRSEMALPLISHRLVIGAMTIQSDQPSAFSPEDITVLQSMADQISNAVENARLYEQIQIALGDTDQLLQASAELNTSQSYTDVLGVIRKYTALGQAAQTLSINVFDQSWIAGQPPEWIELIGYLTNQPSGLEVGTRFPLATFSSAQTLLRLDAPTVFEDLNTANVDPNTRALFIQRLKTQSAIFVPLVAGGQWFGYLTVAYTAPTHFRQEDVRRLTAMASQAAVAIQNLRNLAGAQQALTETDASYRATQAIGRAQSIEAILEATTHIVNLLGMTRATLRLITRRDIANRAVANDIYAYHQVGGQWTLQPIVQNVPVSDYEAIKPLLHNPETVLIYPDAQNPNNLMPEEVRHTLLAHELRSAISTSVSLQDETLGLLSFNGPQALTESAGQRLQLTIRTLSDQMAVALQNRLLFEQTRAALQEVDAINRRLTGEAWETYLHNYMGEDVIHITDDQAVAPEMLLQIDDHLATGEVTLIQDEEHPDEAIVTAPILLRGQPIGALRLRTPVDEWNTDLQAVLTDMAGHIAQAVENARLIEQTQRTASRERTINEINTRVRQTIDLDTILRTAVNELGETLHAKRVVARVGATAAEKSPSTAGNGRGEKNG